MKAERQSAGKYWTIFRSGSVFLTPKPDITASSSLPMIAAWVGDNPVGFVSLKCHTEFSAELYVLGVKRSFHRQGIGRALVDAAVKFANTRGISFLTAKTLAPSNPNFAYAATRKFYEAVGFLPIEVFPFLWDAKNPCLMMIRSLR